MDGAYISAFAALAGTAIGGLASFTTSWVTQNAQTRAQRRAAERDARAALFGRFLDEAAKLYSDALQTSRDDVTGLIQNLRADQPDPPSIDAGSRGGRRHGGSHHRRHLSGAEHHLA